MGAWLACDSYVCDARAVFVFEERPPLRLLLCEWIVCHRSDNLARCALDDKLPTVKMRQFHLESTESFGQ